MQQTIANIQIFAGQQAYYGVVEQPNQNAELFNQPSLEALIRDIAMYFGAIIEEPIKD